MYFSLKVEGNPKGTSSSEEKQDGEDSDDDSSSASEKSEPKKDCLVPNMTLLSKVRTRNSYFHY